MEKRMSDAEKAIMELSKGQVASFQLSKSVAGSMEKIASSLDQLNKFQVETETHRQHDADFKVDIIKKIDKMIDNRETDLTELFGDIKGLQTDMVSLTKDVEENSKDFSNHMIKGEKRTDRIRNSLWTLFVGLILTSLAWWLKN